MITASRVAANTYEVVVDGTDAPTTHTVTLSPEYYRQLCGRAITHEWLIIQAFRFLLERESNSAILPSFDLEEIGRYFPEFEDEIRRRIS